MHFISGKMSPNALNARFIILFVNQFWQKSDISVNRQLYNPKMTAIVLLEDYFFHLMLSIHPPVLPDTKISESGEKVIVTVYSPQDYAAEAWKVHLRLKDGVRSPISGFAFPALQKRLFIPDLPYRKVVISDKGEWDMGFMFQDGVCELHLYSNGIPEEENPVPLKKVVSELISSIESHL